MILTYKNGFTREVHTCLGYMQAIEVYSQISNVMEKQRQEKGTPGTIEIFDNFEKLDKINKSIVETTVLINIAEAIKELRL